MCCWLKCLQTYAESLSLHIRQNVLIFAFGLLRWDFCVCFFAVGLLAHAFDDGLLVSVVLRCTLFLPVGFPRWVSWRASALWRLRTTAVNAGASLRRQASVDLSA